MSQQINLFNTAFLKQKKIFTSDRMAQALGLLLVGIAALVMYGRHSVAKLEREAALGAQLLEQRKVRQASVMVEFAPRQKSKELEAQIAEAEAELAALSEVSTVLASGDLGNTMGYSPYFKALARQAADDLWLTGVAINGAGSAIGLQGRALDANLVPAWIGRLTREPIMRGKSFGSLQISRPTLKSDASKASAPPELAPYIDFSLQAAAPVVPAAAGSTK